MKTLMTIISLACFSSAFAVEVPYNLCANNTKTDCEVLHMPYVGQIDNVAGHATFNCDEGCKGDASRKAIGAVTLLLPRAGDTDYSRYVTYEANPQNLVYIQPDKDAYIYERLVAQQEEDRLTLKYCSFSTENLPATLEAYKKEHDVQAGVTIIDRERYSELKTAFQAQEDPSLCNEIYDFSIGG